MKITEGSFYECKNGEGYVYVQGRDGNEISYIACTEPTTEALTEPSAYNGTMDINDFKNRIV